MMLDIQDRSKIHSPEHERGAVGAMLLDPRTIDDVALIVRPDEFFDMGCRESYRAILAIHEKGKTPDVAGVAAAIKKTCALGDTPAMSVVAEILESCPSAINATWHAEQVRDRYVLRHIADTAAETLSDANTHGVDIAELAERFESRAFEIGNRRVTAHSKSAADIMAIVADELAARASGKVVGLKTDFVDLDRMLVNLRPGTLTLIAARPSMGKSAFAANIADNVAARGEPVCFFSLEMSYLEIGERMLSARSRVPLDTLQRGSPSSQENRQIIEAQSEIGELPLFVIDSPSMSMSEIGAVCRRQKRRTGLALVIVDYLQLIRPENNREPRQEQVAGIGRRLKGLARELQIPVIALAQLNRATEQAAGSRPKLSNLRESGSLEQDADNVLFVHREEYYLPEDKKDAVRNQADIAIAKQRNGRQGTVKLAWFGHVQKFENAAPSTRNDPQQPWDFT